MTSSGQLKVGRIPGFPGLDRLPSGRVRARYRDSDGEQHSKTFAPNEVKLAARWRRSQMTSVESGTHVAPDKVTLYDYAVDWAASQPHEATTASRIDYSLRNHLRHSLLGRMQLQKVRSSHVQRYVTDLHRGGLAASTVGVHYRLLTAVFTSARRDRLIFESPCEGVRLPDREEALIRLLSVEEVRELSEAMPARFVALPLVQAGLGLRVGELLGLKVCDVDFLRREVHIRQQLKPRTIELGKLKTPSSRRDLPLPTFVAEAIAKQIELYPSQDGLVFTGKRGGPLRHQEYSSGVFKPAVLAVGLPKETTPHDLRHHYASLLIRFGIDPLTVAKRLGHSNAQLVLTTYGHLWPDAEARTRAAVDDAWAVSSPVSQPQLSSV